MWKATAALTVEGTVLEGRNGVVIGVGPNSKAATVAFSDCTFRTDSAVMIVLTRQGTGGPLPMTVRRCVLDTDNVTTQYHHPPYPVGGRPTAGEMKTMARKVLNWTESENVYRRKASYLTAWARGRPQSPGDIKTVADWLEYWQQPDVRSIEGDLRFAPRPDGAKNGPPRLEAVEQPSGVVPAWANGR